jgi:hypothetical protein
MQTCTAVVPKHGRRCRAVAATTEPGLQLCRQHEQGYRAASAALERDRQAIEVRYGRLAAPEPEAPVEHPPWVGNAAPEPATARREAARRNASATLRYLDTVHTETT